MSHSSEHTEKIPLWLDCDPGHDDAFAILLAAYHPVLELLGVSTTYGNASLNKTTKNALSILEAIGTPEIPVFPGARKPFCRNAHAAPEIHGESGLDGTTLLPEPVRKPLFRCNAIVDMREALMACPPNTVWLVATGSLTNIALLFATFPDVAEHIRGLSIMGGAVGNNFTSAPLGVTFKNALGETEPRIGNHTPYAEFNIWCDPESAQSVFSNPTLKPKTVLIPLDVTHQAFANKEAQEMVLHGTFARRTRPTKVRQMYYDLLMFFAKSYAEVFGLTEGPPLHDPLAVAVVLHNHKIGKALIEFYDNGCERWDVEVELAGEQMGRTKVTAAEQGIMIPRSLDLGKFWKVLNECLDRLDEKLTSEQ